LWIFATAQGASFICAQNIWLSNPLWLFSTKAREKGFCGVLGLFTSICSENTGRLAKMNWKVKAFAQNCIASFPEDLSREIYFQMQRHFGGRRKSINPWIHFLTYNARMLQKIKQYGKGINGKVFFEIGSGLVPLLPVALWLCGAKKTITMDLKPYMRNELIEDMLFFCKNQGNKIESVLGELLDKERFNILLNYNEKIDKKGIFELCQIEYMAPGDATKTNLPENSVHYHVSHTVYEHIPLTILRNILEEGNRILAEGGLFINFIDYSDHFSHTDRNISSINFLQYSDKEWEKYGRNKYTYVNRARHDEFIELFKAVGHDFLEIEPYMNKEAEEMLRNNKIALDAKFKNKSTEILSITDSWFVTEKSKCH
jgi:SAM-dependent methyltransferase